MKIEIKPLFDGWKEVTEEQALEYAKTLYKNITTKVDDEKVIYINTNRIRGITFTKEQLEGKYAK